METACIGCAFLFLMNLFGYMDLQLCVSVNTSPHPMDIKIYKYIQNIYKCHLSPVFCYNLHSLFYYSSVFILPKKTPRNKTDSDVIIHPPNDSSSVLVTALHTPEKHVVITKACSDQLIILFACENVSHCTKDILNN